MEDILEVYKRAYDAKKPVICMDETTKQLVKEIIKPLPIQPGKRERYDTEYERNGTSNIFIAFEPLKGKRKKVTERRTKVDWAHFI